MNYFYQFTLVLFLLSFFATNSIGQTVFSDEDFDALSNGDKIAENLTTYWDTWSGNPGSSEDGVASNTYAYSSPNSMKIVDGNDVLLYLKSDKTRFSDGYYLYSHYMYVPSTNAGYFNLQALKASIWALEVYINNAGSSYIYYGNAPSLNIDSYVTLDSWMLFEVKVDLDNDLATLWIDDSEVVSWTWSDCGSSELHTVNYWGASNNYIAYFDDIDFEHVYAGGDATICDNATSYTLSEASQNGYDEVEWTSSGTGSFTNSAVINAVYNPSAADKTNGQVTLTISATKTATSTTHTDEMTLSFYDPFTDGAIQTTGETICYDGDPGEIGSTTAASGGDESITYKWQKSTTGESSGFTDISSSNSASYNPPTGLTETTWYRRMAKDGTCNTTFTASTGTWKVTVYDEFTVGSISENQSVCYNTQPAQLTGVAPTGGNTPYSYQWESSTNGTDFSEIGGATNLNYQPPVLTQTTYYQLIQTSASDCGEETTNTVTITVYDDFAVGSISEDQSICYNTAPNELEGVAPSGGNTPYAYQWQSSTDGSSFSDISGATNLNYQPPALTQTTYYQLVQTSASACGEETTNMITITVYDEFTVGSISEDQSFCNSGTPDELTGVAPTGGNTPYTYQWQQSTDGVNFSDISGANDLNYQPGEITDTTYFRQLQISASGCGTLVTDTVTIAIHSLCCEPNDNYCQSPDPGTTTGYISDEGGSTVVYDNFWGIAGGVTYIEWWGGTVDGSSDPCDENPKDFLITFYRDDNGAPGSQYQYATYNVSVTGTYTGTNFGTNNIPIMHYEYVLEKPFSGLTEGWVSIKGYPAGSCEFQWLTSPNGDGKAYVNGNRNEVSEDFAFGMQTNPNIPLSDWAIYLGVLLIALVSGWKVFRLIK